MNDTIYIYLNDTCGANSLYTIVTQSGESWFSWQLSLGETLTIIFTIAAACIAIVQYKSSKKDTWFLNVIVLPQLEPIKQFYLQLLNNSLRKDREDIDKKRKESYDNFIDELALLQKKRKDEINDFFDHIIALVRSYDKDLGDKVSDVVMRLEDTYVQVLECYKDNTNVNEREKILANEQELLSTLNSAMTKKKGSRK